MTGDAQPKEIEQADTYRDRHTTVHDGGGGDHLCPSAREVKEGGLGSDGGEREDGEEQEDGDGTEEALVSHRDERGNTVACCGKRGGMSLGETELGGEGVGSRSRWK